MEGSLLCHLHVVGYKAYVEQSETDVHLCCLPCVLQDVTDMVLQRHAADLPPYIAELLHWEVHSQVR
jgi:hypothetical protein